MPAELLNADDLVVAETIQGIAARKARKIKEGHAGET